MDKRKLIVRIVCVIMAITILVPVLFAAFNSLIS